MDTRHRPLVSIVVIFLNEAKFIEEAIASILAQTYDHWELFLVDDGSTDKSSWIAQHYAQRLPEKIHSLEHPGHSNRGMSASRNLGISQASGKYVSFLDADDVWMPQKLEQQVLCLESHPEAALVCGRAQWWYSWSGSLEDSDRDFIQQLNVPLNTVVKPPTLFLSFLQDEEASLCDVMVRRDILESVGGYEDSFKGLYEDQAFHSKLCLSYPVFVASDCWYRYRQHPDSCCYVSDSIEQWSAARLTFLNWVEQHASMHTVHQPEILQAIQKELFPFRHPFLSRLVLNLQSLNKKFRDLLIKIIRHIFPENWRDWLWHQWVTYQSRYKTLFPVGGIRFGHLRRLTPIDRRFGLSRGCPVDRYYIEKFLSRSAIDIYGHVLEVEDAAYTKRFGGDRVTKSDVLHSPIGTMRPEVTIMADLTCAPQILSNTFDCIILTQTLLFIYDVPSALKTLFRILKPGGVLLVTIPGISQIIREDMELWGDYWRFTAQSAQKLFEDIFSINHVSVNTFGNVLAASAFLYGLSVQDLRQEELDYHDPDYQVIISVRAVKAERSEPQ
jgi:glycosyltransferase involved in cell wall biosynthesis